MTEEKKSNKIAVIRIRSRVGAMPRASQTLDLLKLSRVNTCNVFNDSNVLRGMIRKVLDYVTWGEVDEKILKKLTQNKSAPFRLNTPKKGFERGGVRKKFPEGALGYRGKEINELIKRML